MQTAISSRPSGPSTTSHSPSNSLSSPNAIPPRTSSTGQHAHNPTPSKPVLRPVSEADWLTQSKPKEHRKRSSLSAVTNTNNMASLPPDPNKYAIMDLNFHTRPWTTEKEKILTGPYDYLESNPGKDIRTQLISAFNAWLQVPAPSLTIITHVIGMLHTASLLIDDVEDSSLLRRGLPVAHSIFGTAQTLNSSNYVYFLALQELLKLGNEGEAVRIFSEELVSLHRGQGMDMYWREMGICPSEEEYLEMVGNKTGGLFRLAVRLMQAESKSGRDCVPLVSLIGQIFQIRDDHMNLSSPTYSTNKGLCEDLTEGKFSFPIIHAIRSDPSNLQLLNILKQKTTDEQVKKYAVGYMESKGSFEYSRKVLSVLRERATGLVDSVEGDGDGTGKEAVLKILNMLAVQ